MIPDSVLLVTTSYDEAPEYVSTHLERHGVPFFRLDTDRFPGQVEIQFNQEGNLSIRDGAAFFSGERVKSVWYRRNVAPDLPEGLDSGMLDFCEREQRAFLLGVLASLPTRRWFSDPSAIWRSEQKPYQLAVANSLGFTVPETLITNDQKRVREFAHKHQLVAKAVSSGYIASADGIEAIFTSALTSDDVGELEELSLAPVIFQEMVSKVSDIRVTVVEDDVFAAEILSQENESSRVDWRATEDPHLKHEMHELPHDLVEMCRLLVFTLGLKFGAIDLALLPDGSYVFFEINPNGEWLWIEDQLGFPISEKIARWLMI